MGFDISGGEGLITRGLNKPFSVPEVPLKPLKPAKDAQPIMQCLFDSYAFGDVMIKPCDKLLTSISKHYAKSIDNISILYI